MSGARRRLEGGLRLRVVVPAAGAAHVAWRASGYWRADALGSGPGSVDDVEGAAGRATHMHGAHWSGCASAGECARRLRKIQGHWRHGYRCTMRLLRQGGLRGVALRLQLLLQTCDLPAACMHA